MNTLRGRFAPGAGVVDLSFQEVDVAFQEPLLELLVLFLFLEGPLVRFLVLLVRQVLAGLDDVDLTVFDVDGGLGFGQLQA